ncbi:hypothetical protein Tco_1202648 [Tanacetum coccineum]
MKIEELLNVTFVETPPPSKTSPLVDDDLDEVEGIKLNTVYPLPSDTAYPILCPNTAYSSQQLNTAYPLSLDMAYRSGAIPTKTAEDAKKVIQEMVEYSQKWHSGTSRGRSTKTCDGLAAIQAQLKNLGREIKKVNEKVYAA